MQPSSPVEIRISSDSIKDIRKVEAEINEIVAKTAHIAWTRNDWDQQQQNIKVNLDRDKANRMGYSKGLVATSLMIGLDGLPADHHLGKRLPGLKFVFRRKPKDVKI